MGFFSDLGESLDRTVNRVIGAPRYAARRVGEGWHSLGQTLRETGSLAGETFREDLGVFRRGRARAALNRVVTDDYDILVRPTVDHLNRGATAVYNGFFRGVNGLVNFVEAAARGENPIPIPKWIPNPEVDYRNLDPESNFRDFWDNVTPAVATTASGEVLAKGPQIYQKDFGGKDILIYGAKSVRPTEWGSRYFLARTLSLAAALEF